MLKLIGSACLYLAVSFSLCSQVALYGLFTPVQLQPDTTIIFLRDYLAERDAIGIGLPAGLTNLGNNKDTLVLVGTMKSKLGTATITTKNEALNLLLVAPSGKETTLAIPADKVSGKEVRIIGSFNNWNRGSAPLQRKEGQYTASYFLEPGRYEYKLYVDGQERMDPSNPKKVSNGMGNFNNIIKVTSDPVKPGGFTLSQEGEKVKISFHSGLDEHLVFWNNQLIKSACNRAMNPDCLISIPQEAKKVKRSYLRIYTWRGENEGRNQLIPLEYGRPVTDASDLTRQDWHQARMYFLMVDRFKNGNPGNDEKVNDPEIQPIANYFGGDLTGAKDVIDAGYFDDLGVNTIWLSPITQNPTDAWGLWNKGKVKSKFSGYHGYWPISNVRVDYRFGSDADLQELLDKAHQGDNNVILDYVANHVHINHPVYQNNRDWATELYLPDGTKNTEKWDEYRLTTWFDDHLPTLDLRRYEIVDPMVDSAMVWLTKFDLDGFRHDATKHIDEIYWRTLTYRIRKNTERPIYQIGETYGSPQLINSYISTGMLDAQFDFNLYDAAVSAFATGQGLENLKSVLEQGLQTYGYNHLMGNITGNQDRSRFISLASGDVKFDEDQKLAGWDREIGKPSAQAYKKLAMLHAFNNAVPGIPCIYYGDEIGLPGANDPDNRRMMYFEDLDADEQNLKLQVLRLNKMRASELPLLYGSTEVEVLNPSVLMIKRKYFDQEYTILFNVSDETQTVQWASTHFYQDASLPNLEQFKPNEGIELPPLSYRFLTN